MANVLDHMRRHSGVPTEDFKSGQDEVFPGQEEKALSTVSKELVDNLREQVTKANLDFTSIKLVFVDGFLLNQNRTMRERLDVKLFFRLSQKVAKKRRFTGQRYGSEAKPDEF
jgi:uridine kinase